MMRLLKLVAAGVVVFVLGLIGLAVLAGLGHHSASPTITAAALVPTGEAPVPVAPPPARPVSVAKIGDTVTFSDSVWSVTKAEDLGSTAKSNNQFQPALKSEGGKFIRVVMKVTNLEKKEERLFDPPKLADAQGREFRPVDMTVFYIPEGKKTLQLEAIPPSLPKEFWEVYEVAANSTGLRFMARELSVAGSTQAIDLGLK